MPLLRTFPVPDATISEVALLLHGAISEAQKMTPVPPSLGFHEGVAQPLEKRFEVIKDVGDGSFGSVCLARVRGTRNTVTPATLCVLTVRVGGYQIYEEVV